MYYKILKKKNDTFKTLFHGVNGSRVLNLQTWLKADIKLVADGALHKSTQYISGWHIIKGYENAVKYLKKFKDTTNLTIVECAAVNVRKKKHSPSESYLAEYIYILGEII